MIGGGLVLTSTLSAFAESQAYDDPDALYALLKSKRPYPLTIAGGRIDLLFAGGPLPANRPEILSWIQRSAIAVSTYFGRYPVAEHGLIVIPQAGNDVGHATTYGYDGALTRIHVGVDADRQHFLKDWVLVHEMVHTALPDLPRRALWMQEGNATYVEPIARAEASQLPSDEVWREALIGMPHGQAAAGAGGMDGTRDHDRLYWGGAAFWLLAEIELYEKTSGRRTLRDGLRAVNRASGGNIVTWEPERLIQVTESVGATTALSALYRRFAETDVTLDLDEIFGRLGLRLGPGGAVVVSDQAPLAGLRKRITAR